MTRQMKHCIATKESFARIIRMKVMKEIEITLNLCTQQQETDNVYKRISGELRKISYYIHSTMSRYIYETTKGALREFLEVLS